MIRPSSVAVTRAPIAVRFSAMTSMRLDSLTFSSAASRMMVVPSAKQAITAMTGSSSISVGIRLPSITQPFREELRTRRSAEGSPSVISWGRTVRSAFIMRQTRKIPSLVGFVPTFRIRSSESGVMQAAAIK